MGLVVRTGIKLELGYRITNFEEMYNISKLYILAMLKSPI
jgi:hypothetical protein